MVGLEGLDASSPLALDAEGDKRSLDNFEDLCNCKFYFINVLYVHFDDIV